MVLKVFLGVLLSAMLIAIALIFVNSISSNRKTTNDIEYSFIVAGHTYGKPGVNNEGLHPPFKEKFEFIRKRKSIKFGVFTGDIVMESTPHDWNEVDEDIASLGIPIHFAPGNHDLLNKKLFLERYAIKGKTYYSFEFNKDQFIILDPNIDRWNITGDQLDFLKSTLDESTKHKNNIFVFFHQVIWWDNRYGFKSIKPNSLSGRGESTNFWRDIVPLFNGLSNKVYMFAGDVGAFASHVPIYYNYSNMSLIASGMGGGEHDNFLVVNVINDKEHSVAIDLVWLNKSGHRVFMPKSIESLFYKLEVFYTMIKITFIQSKAKIIHLTILMRQWF